MLGIKIGDVFLQLQAGTSAEMEKNSPLFFTDSILGEYSTPLTVPFTEENQVALQQLMHFLTGRTKTYFSDAELYDGKTFLDRGTFVVETANLNLINVRSASLGGYLLTGISSYFSQVKDVKLKDLELGGERSFAFTTSDPTDASGGFWQHIHATWDGTYDYVFQPCRNEEYAEDVDWMNRMLSGQILYSFDNPLVPFIKLKYLLQCCFEEFGYTVDFSDIDDTDWEKLLIASATPQEWFVAGLPGVSGTLVYSFMRIILNKHVDQEATVSNFIMETCKRYAWYPAINKGSKTCKMIALRNVPFSKETKDWTKYVQPQIVSDFSQEAKVYSFSNNFKNDNYPSEPDFSGYTFNGSVLNYSDLPTPSTGDDKALKLVVSENKWYHVEFDGTSLFWVPFADNIYNYEPADNNDDVSTDMSPVPSMRSLYRTSGLLSYYGIFPIIKAAAYSNLGYRTLFYHGMVDEQLDNGSAGPLQYPLASSSRYNPSGSGDLDWSNVFIQEHSGDSSGIIEYWHKNWLAPFTGSEDDDVNFNLPLHELANFDFKDVILIRNIPFLVTKYLQPIPYKGLITATLKRIYYTSIEGSVAPVSVYVRLEIEDETTGGSQVLTDPWNPGVTYNYTNIHAGRVYARFYSDAAGTIPTTVSGLTVTFRLTSVVDSVLYTTTTYNRSATGTEVEYIPGVPMYLDYDYDYDPGTPPYGAPEGHYVDTYTLDAGPGYTVIP